VIGGPGKDFLSGGAGNDSLTGGPGVDTFFGRSGNDRIYAADGVSELVNCGSGRDVAQVDPTDRVTGCERVVRRRVSPTH
jgi:Ca2+-binding RTX toxin-like protein